MGFLHILGELPRRRLAWSFLNSYADCDGCDRLIRALAVDRSMASIRTNVWAPPYALEVKKTSAG
jgi:hypothetical protein